MSMKSPPLNEMVRCVRLREPIALSLWRWNNDGEHGFYLPRDVTQNEWFTSVGFASLLSAWQARHESLGWKNTKVPYKAEECREAHHIIIFLISILYCVSEWQLKNNLAFKVLLKVGSGIFFFFFSYSQSFRRILVHGIKSSVCTAPCSVRWCWSNN